VIADVWTVAWKELKQTFAAKGMLGGARNILLLLGIFGVVQPSLTGLAWIEQPTLLMYWAWFPLLVTSGLVVTAIAGEREAHTLETLLASRLPDMAILLGKILAGVIYGWGITIGSLLGGLVTVNIMHWSGQFLFYPLVVIIGAVFYIILVAWAVATTGVLVSLRAPSVRAAQQAMSLGLLGFLFVPFFVFTRLPQAWQAKLSGGLSGLSPAATALLVAGGLILLNAILLAAAATRFKRAKLILD